MNKVSKKQPGKIATTFGYIVVFGVIALVIWVIVALASGGSKPVAKQSSPPTTKPPTAAVKLTPDQLKIQSMKILTDKVSDYEKVYHDASLAATQPGAEKYHSDFWYFWDDIEHGTKYDTYIKAFNDVSNLYDNSGQTQPSALDDWSSDMSALWSDMQNYTDSEHMVLADKVTNTDTTADQNKVAAADTKYTSDLAKVKVDISRL